MTETAIPIGLAADLVRIHKVLTRGMNVGIDASQRFAEFGFDDDTLKDGFIDYIRAFVILLDSHHSGEDVISFPLLRSRAIEAPYEDLLSEHHQMEPWIDKTRLVITDINSAAHLGQSLDALCYALKEIREIWRPHIMKEEQSLTAERISAQLSPTEQAEISQQLARFSMERAQPSYLTIPFVLYNLQASDRLVMMNLMPPHIIQDLLPGEWRERWERMLPFFLA